MPEPKITGAPTTATPDYQGAGNVPATTPDEEAIRIVMQEKMAWENSIVYVTPQVAFNLPVLLRTVLKNYYGIFDEPVDPITGQEKLWVPLTETLCETVVKSTDLSTKDIDFRALNPEAVGYTRLVRAAVRQHLNKIFFGEKLKEAIRALTIWGTVVWSTEEVKGQLDVGLVNLLNFYIEPTAPSISAADKVTERFPMTISEFQRMAAANQWKNWKDVTGRVNVPRYDSWLQLQNYPSMTLFVEVFRMRGMVPRFVFTGNPEDMNEYVAAEVIVSWDNGTWRFHDATLRKSNANKGYEEAWLTRVPQRWQGKGIAEKSMAMQVYANITLNVRKTRAQVSQLGTFKVKRGSGVTAQSLQRLAVNGAVLVNSMEDVQQFEMADIPMSSYKDEEVLWQWAQRVTQAQEITAGDTLPASTPATNAAIQNQQANGAYVLIKENTGLWLERWLRNQALPIIMRNMSIGDIVHYTGDPDDIRMFDEHLVNKMLIDDIEKATKEGRLINPQFVQQEMQNALLKLQKFGSQRFVHMEDIMNPLDYDCEVKITNEKVDAGIMSQRIIQALQLAPQESAQLLPALFDILGLPYKPTSPAQVQQGQPLPPPQPGGAANVQPSTSTNPAQQMTAANTAQG